MSWWKSEGKSEPFADYGQGRATSPVENDRDVAVQLSKDLIAAVQSVSEAVHSLRLDVKALDETLGIALESETPGRHKKGTAPVVKVELSANIDDVVSRLEKTMKEVAGIPNEPQFNRYWSP